MAKREESSPEDKQSRPPCHNQNEDFNLWLHLAAGGVLSAVLLTLVVLLIFKAVKK